MAPMRYAVKKGGITVTDATGYPTADMSGRRRDVADATFEELYDDLRVIARRVLRGKRHSILQTTLLVHEGYLRLCGQRVADDSSSVRWTDQDHLLHLMAMAMRRALIDAIREDQRLKAGGDRCREPLFEDACVHEESWTSKAIDVDEALTELARVRPDLARVEECRIFGGHTIPETARILRVSQNTVKKARAHLRRLLTR